MDGKFWYPSLLSCHAALGAWATGKPVRLVLSAKEDFRFSPKRFGVIINIASALDGDGKLLGTEIDASLNLGAFGVNAAEMLDQTCLGTMGMYSTKNIRFRGTAFLTNTPPRGPFCGFGMAQGAFAQERHASVVADELGMDPAEWRRNNFVTNNFLPSGLPISDEIPMNPLMDTASRMSGYRRKWSAYELLSRKRKETGPTNTPPPPRGIGIAVAYQGSGLLHTGNGDECGVGITLEKDGSLEIRTGMADFAGGTAWADVACEILGVDRENVRLIGSSENPSPSRERIPESGPVTMSRMATTLTSLVEEACIAIQGQRFRDPLPISVRRTAVPGENPEWNERFALPGGGGVDCGGFLRPGSAVAVVEVEIDPVECVPRIRGVWLAVDGGRILRPDRAARSLRLATVQALGWVCRERAFYVAGRIPEEDFDGFTIPGASEIPPITLEFGGDALSPPPGGGAKGIGDLPFACVPAAYLQAVSQATDGRIRSIPFRTRYSRRTETEPSPEADTEWAE